MKEFLMTEFFSSPAAVTKYISTRKIPKRKILSLIHNGEKYVLFYYTTMRKYEKKTEKLGEENLGEI